LEGFTRQVATKQNLLRRSVHVVDSLCVLCGSEEETISHLLISCLITNSVWNLCHNWIGVSFVNHFAMKEHFEQFHCTWFSNKVISCGKECGFPSFGAFGNIEME